jgi:hypothetical protein
MLHKKKHTNKIVLFFAMQCCICTQGIAQGFTNFGNLHIFTGGNIASALPFVNNAGVGTNYVNDGNFFTTNNFANNKAAMPAGTGNTTFNGTAIQQIGGSNTPQFNNIIIQNNAGGLRPAALNYTFNVAGNWVNNGVFAHQKGTVVFNGTAAETISGTAAKTVFYNFNLSNPTSLSLTQNTDLINAFSFKNVSNATLASAGFLTVKSADSITAQIADITDNNTLTGNTITGDVTIERYLFAKLAWRYLATPIAIAATPTITQSWRENNSSIAVSTGYGTRITGPGAIGVNGVDAYTQRGSLKYYNDTTNTFREIAATNVGIANTRGYFVFVRGDRSVAPGGSTGATTLRMRGNIRMNNQGFSVLANKFQSFGNPYASRIDFRNVAKTTVVDAFTIWQPNNVGAYNVGGYENYALVAGEYWLNGITTGVGAKKRNYIESGEAVFIQSVTGGSITIEERDKADSSALVSREAGRTSATIATLDINLFIKNTSTPTNDSLTLLDGVSINFDDAYSNTIDNDDVKKIANSFDNLMIKSNNTNIVVERRTMPSENDTIQLNLTGTRIGIYNFNIYPSLLEQINVDAFWVDKFLNTSTPLSLFNETDMAFVITADAASKAADRYMIVFKQVVVLPFSFINIAAIKNNNGTHSIPYSIANERYITQYQIERSDKPINFVPIKNMNALYHANGNYGYNFIDSLPINGDNYYRVKATDIHDQIYYSAIVKILADNKEPSIAVYPNPITDNVANLQFVNSKGSYTLKLMSVDGKEIQTQQANISTDNEIKTMPINKAIAAGNYILLIHGENKNEQIKIIIQ